MRFSAKLIAALLFLSLATAALPVQLWAEPTDQSLATAIKAGDFGSYLAETTKWLDQRVASKKPSELTQPVLLELLNDPQFASVLAQREFIFKTGVDELNAFVKADAANGEFLAWLLPNTEALNLYLQACVPVGLAAREENKHRLSVGPLAIWKKIMDADPEARSGLYLRLAMATGISPPGSVNIGAGGSTPEDPVVRYQYFKAAHKNKELFPSFDNLTVWELTHIVCSGASNSDLTWAREMINTFRPDLRVDEMVVNSTSLVWRRNAPAPFWRPECTFDGTFKNVLAGGGKCGPRSSWSQMICHAFGVLAIGVGQPGHACVAFKAANPLVEPQPGSAWKVAFGAGWQRSKLLGLAGPDFLAGVAERDRAATFAQVEQLRWLASSLQQGEHAAAIMDVAHTIQKSTPVVETDLTASLKPEEAEAEPGAVAPVKPIRPTIQNPAELAIKTAGPINAVDGVLHIEAAAFSKTGGEISWAGQFPHVLVHDCFTGGKQIYFQQQMKSQWADYEVDIPAAGTYELTIKAACINVDQALEICSGDQVLAQIPLDLSYGLWKQTAPVKLKLEQGVQTLRLRTPTTEHKRGIAVRSLELKASGS